MWTEVNTPRLVEAAAGAPRASRRAARAGARRGRAGRTSPSSRGARTRRPAGAQLRPRRGDHPRPGRRLPGAPGGRLRQPGARPSSSVTGTGTSRTWGPPTAPTSTAGGWPVRWCSSAATASRSATPCWSSSDGRAGRTRLRWGGATDVGASAPRTRTSSWPRRRRPVGRGRRHGRAPGRRVASEIACDTLARTDHHHTIEGLVDAIEQANTAVYRAGAGDPDLSGMGTTVVALAVVAHDGDELLALANVGDPGATVLGRRARPAHHRSQPGGGPGAGGQPVARRGVHPPAAQHPHPGPRRVRGRAGRRLRRRAPPRRPLPAVLRRAVQRGRRGRHRRRPAAPGGPGRRRRRAGAPGPRGRRPRQHHRRRRGRGRRRRPGRGGLRLLAGEPTRSAPVVGAPGPARPTPTTGPRPAVRAPAEKPWRTPPRTTTTTATTTRDGDGAGATSAAAPRRFTWRVALFTLVLLAVVGRLLATIQWYGRSAYFVGLDGDQVAIFKGRPGGLLWIEPTLVETSDLDIDRVPEAGQRHRGRQGAAVAGGRPALRRQRDRAGRRAGPPATTDDLHRPLTTTTLAPPAAPA